MIIDNLSTIKVHHRIHVNDKNFKTYQHYQIAKRLFKAETIEILKEANKEPYKNYSPSSTSLILMPIVSKTAHYSFYLKQIHT